jgi:hypothetical protein
LGKRLVVGDLGHHVGHGLAEAREQLVVRGLGVFDRVVQHRSDQRGHVGDAGLHAQHPRQLDRVVDVGAGVRVATPLVAVLLGGEGQGVEELGLGRGRRKGGCHRNLSSRTATRAGAAIAAPAGAAMLSAHQDDRRRLSR